MKDFVLKTREHGGDPKAAEARFGVPKDGWLDLSTGINPVAYPVEPCPSELLHRLPLQQDLDDLLAAARRTYNVPDHAAIVASPGTQALIQQVPTLFEAGAVNIVSPTYGEHAPAWTAAGHVVTEVFKLNTSSPYTVVVHPNNPDGRTHSVESVLKAAEQGTVVVDEAFADVMPDLSITPHAGPDGLIILRSFGKFYGLAGVRLGFAICSESMAAKLNEKLGPWAVSGPALWAGTKALKDDAWALKTRQRLKSDTDRLHKLLTGSGLKVIGGTDLFTLCETPIAQAVYEKLAHSGILVRPFETQSDWLRFGLPGHERDWERLALAL